MTKRTPAEERDRYLEILREIHANNAYTGALPAHLARIIRAIVEGKPC
jgi:hypothetical protein